MLPRGKNERRARRAAAAARTKEMAQGLPALALLLWLPQLTWSRVPGSSCVGQVFADTCEPNGQCDPESGCSVLHSFQSTNQTECCDKCSATEGCAAWTLNLHGQKCWLRTKATARQPGDCVSGELVPGPPGPAPAPAPPLPPPPRGPPVPPAPSPAGIVQPSIIFMLADDLGYNDVGFSVRGNAGQIPTPHLDALLATGARLSHYYVQPVCSPTRSSLLSGRHVIHTGIYSPFGHGTVGALSRRFTLLPEYLKKAGYETAMGAH